MLDKLPNSGGISPLNLLPGHSPRNVHERLSDFDKRLLRSSSMTRPSSSVVTPYQCPMCMLLSQFALLPQFGPSVALYRATRAALSRLAGVRQTGSLSRDTPSAFKLGSPAGMQPVNWLSARYSLVRLDRLPNSAGISPANWFSLSKSAVRLARFPNSDGISPLSWLLTRYSLVRLGRLPNSGGIAPLKSL